MHIFNNTHLEGLYTPTGDAVAMNTDECNYSDSEYVHRLVSAKIINHRRFFFFFKEG